MEPFQFQNPRDKRIHDKLKFIGPGPAAFFKDILRIWKLDRQFLESETHLVSHLFREIESALRDTLRTEDEKPKGGSKNHLQDVKKILGKLDISLEHPVAELWLRFADKSFKYQFNKLAHRDSLVAPRERKIEIIESWNDFLTVLEYIIEQFKENYFIAIEVIDKVLKKEHPSKKDAKIIAGNIPHNQATLSYLFDKCNNPNWLPLFRTKGFFQHPPPTIYNEDGSWQYPPWPAGKFIQKMASESPSETSEIIQEVPDTDNLSAIDDLVYALGSIPPFRDHN